MAKGPAAPFFCTLSRDAPRLEARAPAQSSHDARGWRRDPALLPRRLRRAPARHRCRRGFRDGDLPALQPRRVLSQLQRFSASGQLPGVERRVDQSGRPDALAPRIPFPQRRRQAQRPVDGHGSRADGAAAPAPSEHDSLDQINRDRPGHGRRVGAGSSGTWRSVTTSQSTAIAS